MKAGILFYLMVKNHPFTTANKRIAMTTLLYLLYKNGTWIQVDNTEFYTFAQWIAESLPRFKTETVSAVTKSIKFHIIPLA